MREEAIIVDHTMGGGKYDKMLGGLVCRPLKNMDTYHLVDLDDVIMNLHYLVWMMR